MKFIGWFSPRTVIGFWFWIFWQWNDYGEDKPYDNIRILGFEFARRIKGDGK